MATKEFIVNALVTAVQNDIEKGKNKQELLHSLSNLVHADIFNKVKERI